MKKFTKSLIILHQKIALMNKTTLAGLLSALILCCACTADNKTVVFFDAKKGVVDVTEQGVTTELKNGELFVTTVPGNNTPGIVLKGHWSLPESSEMQLVVTNHDDRPLTLRCRVVSPHPSDSILNFSSNNVTLAPGETRDYRFNLPMKMPEALKEKFFGMRGNPFGMQNNQNNAFDPHNVTQFILTTGQNETASRWSVSLIAARAVEALFLSHVPIDRFFPMIDKYGQFKHRDWPGKIYDDDDLKKAITVEKADMAANPSPKDRNQYGGWTAGPRHEATGHFRTEKIDGKWWLVDPKVTCSGRMALIVLSPVMPTRRLPIVRIILKICRQRKVHLRHVIPPEVREWPTIRIRVMNPSITRWRTSFASMAKTGRIPITTSYISGCAVGG